MGSSTLSVDCHIINMIMKLQELQGVKSHLDAASSIRQVEQVLRKHGFIELGEGAHATVWEVPGKPYVLKLFMSSDQAYLNFVRMTKQNVNPHFPKFRGSPIPLTDQVHAIRMERLVPFQHNSASALNRGIYALLGLLEHSHRHWESEQELAFLSAQEQQDIKLLFKKWPQLKSAVHLIIQHLVKHTDKIFLDLHDENIMLRPSGAPVFTDPFAS